MPEWIRAVNRRNPVSYLVEAIRALTVTGYDWPTIGAALLPMAILGLVLHVATIWAFDRLTR